MAADTPTKPPTTLGLTGLTVNAMALIAPGAFLWLTFFIQASYGAPLAAQGMWFGILAAVLLCLATAIAYAELSKLLSGRRLLVLLRRAGVSSRRRTSTKFARIAKFIVGWASHLYYWGYPGLMVGVTALIVGYVIGQIWPDTFNAAVPSPLFMMLFCTFFAFGVAYIAYRGVDGHDGRQRRDQRHPDHGAPHLLGHGDRLPREPSGRQRGAGRSIRTATRSTPCSQVDAKGAPVKDAEGQLRRRQECRTAARSRSPSPTRRIRRVPRFPIRPIRRRRSRVPVPPDRDFGRSRRTPSRYMIIQACIAILILVGFESVTSMGEEAKNPKRDIPRAVILSLLIQGVFCYLFEYFAANYFMNNGYQVTNALGSAAPIGDMMIIVGTWMFGSPGGRQGVHAGAGRSPSSSRSIGTTLSCMNTGARVTYAMGRDEEVPEHFGMLHGEKLTPHRAIWTLAGISAVIGILADRLQLLRSGGPDRRGHQGARRTTSGTASASSGTIWRRRFRRVCSSSR